jgi:hypothetical protein
MTVRREAEYAALRATIRERGTARMALLPAIFIGWAAIAIAAAGVITVPVSTLVPLLVLAAGFEALFALHLNVERIGRYLQTFHEDGGPHADASLEPSARSRGWEHVAMAYGQRFPGSGPDPLFGRLFVLAISVNFLPAALNFEFIAELILLALPHFVLINRIRLARIASATQRAEDLRRFTELKDTP